MDKDCIMTIRCRHGAISRIASGQTIQLRRLVAGGLLVGLASTGQAQTAINPITLSIFPPSVTNPFVTPPVAAPVRYPTSLIPCGQPKTATPTGKHFAVDDPSDG